MDMLINFLNAYGLDGLERGIKTRRSAVNPLLTLLVYDQIESPMGDPIVERCRGTIVRDGGPDGFSIVCRPFDRFYNHGERWAAPIDWDTARVTTKLDGSMCSLFFDADLEEWRVATKGSPDASGNVRTSFGPTVSDITLTFADLFWQTFERQFGRADDALDHGTTFIFELTSPMNRVVVRYPDDHLTLIGARNNASGEEYHPWMWPEFNPVKWHTLDSVEETLSSMDGRSGVEFEGYVVVDAAFRRLKIKNPSYLAISKSINGGPTQQRVVGIILRDQADRVAEDCPEWRAAIDETRAAMTAFEAQVAAAMAPIAAVDDMKAFAAEATRFHTPAILFMLKRMHIATTREFFHRSSDEAVRSALERATATSRG